MSFLRLTSEVIFVANSIDEYGMPQVKFSLGIFASSTAGDVLAYP